uniref:Receptor-type tyrosine-protein phosphatase F-like n=1 Tax=Saccoglossus kowalevskii TaxID=10224 RepID=A0ABM0MKV5_SACKO
PATIVEIPDSQEIEISSAPVFTCSGHGKPLPEVTWQTINGGPISESDTEIIEDGYFMNSTLTFNSVDRNDNGIYQCVVNNGYDDVSENFTLTVLEVPDQVIIITFIATNAETIELKWEVTYDANGIEQTLILTGLVAYTEYEVWVTAVNTVGDQSEYSEKMITRTLEGVPDSPVISSFHNTSDSALTIEWDPPINSRGVTKRYELYLFIKSDRSDVNSHIELAEQTATYTYLFTGLLANTEYTVEIKVCNGRNCSLTEEKSAKTSEGIPSMPLNVEAMTGAKCKVCWEEPDNTNGVISHYRLEYAIDARTPPESNYETEEDSWKINTWENEPNQLCYDISEAYNLKPYSHYKVNVRAATYGGESDPSEEAAVCKTDPEAPEMIEEPSKPSNENSRSSDKTFWMQLPSVSQRNGPISCYEIIVVPAADVNTSKSPDELFPPSKVKDYDTASDTDAYVAIKLT